jgi:hypothetical protein
MTTYQTLDFALDLPGRWKATKDPERDLVVVHEKPYEQGEDPDLLDEALVVQRIEDDGGASSLSAYAETLMRRFVRQGEPGRSSATLGNVRADRYEWTDGTTKVVTYFLEPSRHQWFRVDYSNKDHRLQELEVRNRAGRLLRGIRWGTPAGAIGGSSPAR